MNPSHDGTDEQMFGAQFSDGPGMNPSHHGSDEQVFGAKQQVLGTGPSD
jgi:hypothetical protein